MQKINYGLIFQYITKVTMTALTFAAILLFREVVLLKYCESAPLGVYEKIPSAIEDILGAVVMYLIFTFIAVRFTPRQTND